VIFIIMKDIIKNCKTFSEAIKKVFGYDNGKTRNKFMILIEEQNIDVSHLTSKRFLYDRVVKKCPVCEKEFETIINHRNEKTTCSYSCSNTFFRSGENNPNWGSYGDNQERNGYRRIGFNFHKKECVICGENKIVAIHHFDENHNNNSPENLIPLCPTHHQYVHSKHINEVIDKINFYRDSFIKMSS
jgi:hypothetical protein